MPKLISAIFALLSFMTLNSESIAQDAIKVGYAIQAHQANMMVLPKFAEKYGLKVDLVGMRRFPDLQLALTTHQIDAAVLGYVNIALLEESNTKNYKAVSGVYVAPGSLVLAPDIDSKVKTWKDLEGKSLGTAPNGAIDMAHGRNGEDTQSTRWALSNALSLYCEVVEAKFPPNFRLAVRFSDLRYRAAVRSLHLANRVQHRYG